MIKKHLYVAPVTECTEVAIEKRFLTETFEGSTDNSSFGEKGTVTTVDENVWQWMN